MKTIEDILGMDDAHFETIPIPEWNGVEIRVQSMTGTERAEIEKKWSKRKASDDPAAFRIDVLFRTLKTETGTPFGTEEQIAKLIGKNCAAVERLFEAATRVSALSNNDVRELEKN